MRQQVSDALVMDTVTGMIIAFVCLILWVYRG